MAAFVALLTALTPALGAYLQRTFGRAPKPIEGRLLAAYAVLRTQSVHPFAHGIDATLPWDVAFNTVVSFVSNTSWQFYAGETSLTTFSQMAAIALHSRLSAAVGLAAGVAVIRGFARRGTSALGNFWADLLRGLIYVLFPLGLLGAVLMIAGGVVQNLDIGPVATQAAIKTLGSVGGGYFNTALYAAVTTAGASGAVNGAMESLSGPGALAPLSLMMTGELAFGGIGTGLSSMLLVVLLTVFVAGLLVGRTPEYVGRKLDVRTVRLVVIGTLAAPMLALARAGLATASEFGRTSIFDSGPQGFSETLYAYASQTMNNGSAFAGYTGFVQPADAAQFGISFANVMGGLAMLAGRYVPMLAALAVAGAVAARPVMATGRGTLRTDTPTFVLLVLAMVLVVVLLTFAPALVLGSGVQGLDQRLF